MSAPMQTKPSGGTSSRTPKQVTAPSPRPTLHLKPGTASTRLPLRAARSDDDWLSKPGQ